jgi:DNA-binding transcriptional MocR family regulator
MSSDAKCLYTLLLGRYHRKRPNNGRLYLSHRTAAEELGLHRRKVLRAFHELRYYGFIAVTAVARKDRAPHLRLTELPCNGEPATSDFLRWDGVRFERRVTKSARGAKCGSTDQVRGTNSGSTDAIRGANGGSI